MAPKYKVTYFPFKALGEPIRLLLSYGDIEFEDVRISREDFPKLKQSMPLGQMPTLEIDDKVYYQSVAISRYLGKELGLSGKNNQEDLEIDISVDSFSDFKTKVTAATYEQDPELKKKKCEVLLNELFPFYLTKLDANAAKNNGHFALGRLTWADFYFAGLIDYLSFVSNVDILAKYPNLKAVKDNVLALPAIKAWYEKSPQTNH